MAGVHPKAVLSACCAAIVTISFGLAAPALCMPAMAAELKLDYAMQGLVFSAPMWSFLASLAAARLADRIGFRRIVVLASLLQAAGWALLAQAASFPHALAAAALLGVGGAVVDPLLTPLVCAVYPRRRTRMSNFLHAFFCVGLASTVLGVMVLQQAGLSWRGIYRVMAALCLPYGLAAVLLPLPAFTHQGPVRQRTRSLVRKPVFWLLTVAMAMAGATEIGPATWLPTFVQSLSPNNTGGGAGPGTGLLLFGVLMAVARFLASGLAGRLGTRRLLMAAAALCTLCLAATALPLGTTFRVICLGLVGLGVACFWPTLLAVAGDRFPAAGATMFSVLSASGSIGCAAAPVAIGWIAETTGSLAAALAALAVAPAVILAIFSRRSSSP